MRVLQLITQGRGGPVDHAVEVAIELARQGHDSHLAGPPGPHPVTTRSLFGLRMLTMTGIRPDACSSG